MEPGSSAGCIRILSFMQKPERQRLIESVIGRRRVGTQHELGEALAAAGCSVTQATLSRDLRELGLVKGGATAAYQAPVAAGSNGHPPKALLNRAIADYLTRVDRVQQLVVMRTGPGQAQLLGVALDSARLPEVIGTIAGDDTVLAISPDTRRAQKLVKWLEGISRA